MIRVFQDGTEVNLSDYGLRCLSFNVESLVMEQEQERMPGRPGSLLIDGDLLSRNITARFLSEAADNLDYKLLQNALYRLFDPRKEITIIDNREPGKRWFIRTQGAYTPERLNHVNSTFELNLLSARPFAESLGSTLDPKTFDAEVWAVGNELTIDETDYKYANNNTFSIYNAGDEVIDPRFMPLLITYKGTSTNLKIKNITTGEEWAHTGASNIGDTITLDGIRSFKNGLSVYRNTNRKLITLKPGWNDFQLTGALLPYEITFQFRFYYI
jgi:hypothetical protein